MSIFDQNNFNNLTKRAAPRYKAELKASVIITVVSGYEDGHESYFVMQGDY